MLCQADFYCMAMQTQIPLNSFMPVSLVRLHLEHGSRCGTLIYQNKRHFWNMCNSSLIGLLLLSKMQAMIICWNYLNFRSYRNTEYMPYYSRSFTSCSIIWMVLSLIISKFTVTGPIHSKIVFRFRKLKMKAAKQHHISCKAGKLNLYAP